MMTKHQINKNCAAAVLLFVVAAAIQVASSNIFERVASSSSSSDDTSKAIHRLDSASNLVKLGDGFYYFESNLKANWYVAIEFCRNMGLYLASMETFEENEMVKEYIANTTGYASYWLSGSDLGETGSYLWTSTGLSFTYTDWHSGEPSHTFGESCVHFDLRDGLFRWNDGHTDTEMHIICEQLCEPCQQGL